MTEDNAPAMATYRLNMPKKKRFLPLPLHHLKENQRGKNPII